LKQAKRTTDDVRYGTASSPKSLSQQQKRLEEQRKAIQDGFAADRKLMAAGQKRIWQEEKTSELQGELDMVSGRERICSTTMRLFVNESDAKRAKAAREAHIGRDCGFDSFGHDVLVAAGCGPPEAAAPWRGKPAPPRSVTLASCLTEGIETAIASMGFQRGWPLARFRIALIDEQRHGVEQILFSRSPCRARPSALTVSPADPFFAGGLQFRSRPHLRPGWPFRCSSSRLLLWLSGTGGEDAVSVATSSVFARCSTAPRWRAPPSNA